MSKIQNMQDVVVGYQGVWGSYSSEAAAKYFGNQQNFKNFAKFEDVFRAVEGGEIAFGVIPLENSYAGRVAEIHNLFPLYNLYIIGEVILPIRHKLLAKTGARLENIKTIYSHEQAHMQCSKSIEATFAAKLNNAPELTNFANTALAAKYVAEGEDFSVAAIASGFAQQIYNLHSLVDDFADSKTNHTTFVVLAREADFSTQQERSITSVMFTVRNIPGAIYKAIGGFATNGVDLLKLESYIPGGICSSAAQFFLSFRGHINQPNVRLAMEELGFFAASTKLLGCYKHDALRSKV